MISMRDRIQQAKGRLLTLSGRPVAPAEFAPVFAQVLMDILNVLETVETDLQATDEILAILTAQ